MNESCELQVLATHYKFSEYMHKRRWCSLYHQLEEIVSSNPEKVLEIGLGSGLLGVILNKLGINYESLDIDPQLQPTYMGSVLDIPLDESSYDTVVCCQVLEHLPYDVFAKALNELFRVAKRTLIISLPDVGVVYPIHIHRLFVHKLVCRPFLKRVHEYDGEHYWEINKKNFGLEKIKKDMVSVGNDYGFQLERHYRVWENPYHHFFIFTTIC